VLQSFGRRPEAADAAEFHSSIKLTMKPATQDVPGCQTDSDGESIDQPLLVEATGSVVYLTLNRPAQYNAPNAEMVKVLRAAVAQTKSLLYAAARSDLDAQLNGELQALLRCTKTPAYRDAVDHFLGMVRQ